MTHDELLARIKEGQWVDRNEMHLRSNALRAVVDLHKPAKSNRMIDICEVCILPIQDGAFMHREYPCPTIQAIEKELR